MKTTKLIIITIALLLLGGKAIAQNAKKARQIIDKTAAVIGNNSGATANFTISGGKYGRVPGTISIKGQKFTASTSAVKVWFDGRTQWTYMKSTNEVNISTPNEAQRMAMNPYGFVTMYKSGYNLSMKPSGKNTVVHMKATTAGRSVHNHQPQLSARGNKNAAKHIVGEHIRVELPRKNPALRNVPFQPKRFSADRGNRPAMKSV